MSGIKKHSLLFLLLCLFGCYERQEGCLDLFSNNFDAFADDPCAECCTYPSLKVQVKNRLDTLVFSPATLVSNGLGDSFLIIKAGLILSDFQLDADNGFLEVFEVENFALEDGSGEIELTDDFVGITSDRGSSFTSGGIKAFGPFKGFETRVGIDPSIPSLVPGELSDSHPLGTEGGFWEEEMQYSGGFLEVLFDTLTMDTVRYILPSSPNFIFSADTAFIADYGEDITLKLKMDYLAWTEGINFDEIGENRDSVGQILVSNLPKAVTLDD